MAAIEDLLDNVILALVSHLKNLFVELERVIGVYLEAVCVRLTMSPVTKLLTVKTEFKVVLTIWGWTAPLHTELGPSARPHVGIEDLVADIKLSHGCVGRGVWDQSHARAEQLCSFIFLCMSASDS